MIKFVDINKTYGDNIALDISELEIPKGQTFGLVGNNGAGKTTMLSLLLDLIPATKGEAVSNGKNVRLTAEWKKYTGAFLDETFLIGYLSPSEYFDFIAGLRGVSTEELKSFLEQFKEFFNDEVLTKKKMIRDLSKGNQKKVGVVAALIGSPEVVILDEPFANLDPSTQFRLRKIIEKLSSDTETTFLISSHDLIHVTEVCDRIVVLDKGNIIEDLEKKDDWLGHLEAIFRVEN
jgi:ABC-2 type transport system ATP-binding protein